MDAKTRRKLEMGTRALDFSRTHPDTSPGYAAAVARLEERLARADQLAGQQRAGQLEVRAATVRKQELRRAMTKAHLVHLAQAAKIAGREVPGWRRSSCRGLARARTWRSGRRRGEWRRRQRIRRRC